MAWAYTCHIPVLALEQWHLSGEAPPLLLAQLCSLVPSVPRAGSSLCNGAEDLASGRVTMQAAAWSQEPAYVW